MATITVLIFYFVINLSVKTYIYWWHKVLEWLKDPVFLFILSLAITADVGLYLKAY